MPAFLDAIYNRPFFACLMFFGMALGEMLALGRSAKQCVVSAAGTLADVAAERVFLIEVVCRFTKTPRTKASYRIVHCTSS